MNAADGFLRPEGEPMPSMEQSSFYHTGDITPEQAQLLNQNFNFVVVGGIHGQTKGPHVPTDEVYDSVSFAVSSLDPAKGDMLFIEAEGYSGSETAIHSYHGAGGRGEMTAFMRRVYRNIDAFNYGAMLATSRGVPVRYADMHGDVQEAYLREMGISKVPGAEDFGNEKYNRYQEARNAQAAYTVKDTALANLDDALLRTNKPTYLQLMGDLHVKKFWQNQKTVPELYAEMNLDADTVSLTDLILTLRQVRTLESKIPVFLIALTSES
jgi:hypothetical protein